MSVISIRTSDEEKRMIQVYADFFGVSMSDFIRTAVLDKIETLHDLWLIEDYEKEAQQDNSSITSHADIMKEFDES